MNISGLRVAFVRGVGLPRPADTLPNIKNVLGIIFLLDVQQRLVVGSEESLDHNVSDFTIEDQL